MKSCGIRLFIGGGIVLLVIFILLIIPFWERLTPTILTVHISGKAWKSVTITKYADAPVVFLPPRKIVVSPISYGPYTIHVEFAGNQDYWTTYYQYDAGVRRKVDMYLHGSPSNSMVTMHIVAYGNRSLYFDTVDAATTSAEKPLRIER